MKKPEIIDGMKGKFIGEFSFATEEPCPVCALDLEGHIDDVKCLCGGSEEQVYLQKRVVPWDVCKDIYQQMASFAAKQEAEL